MGSIIDQNILRFLMATDKRFGLVYRPERARGKISTVVIFTIQGTLFHTRLCSTKIHNSGSSTLCVYHAISQTFVWQPLQVPLHIQHLMQATKNYLDFGMSRSIRRPLRPQFSKSLTSDILPPRPLFLYGARSYSIYARTLSSSQ
jgi:hypothetical protein